MTQQPPTTVLEPAEAAVADNLLRSLSRYPRDAVLTALDVCTYWLDRRQGRCQHKPRSPVERGRAKQAAAILGLKSRKLQAMSQRGEIPGAAKIKRQWTYDLAKLRRFVEQQEQTTKCQNEK